MPPKLPILTKSISAKSLFAKYHIVPSPSVELADIVMQSLAFMEEDDLGTFLQLQRRFDVPVHIGGKRKPTYHFALQNSLSELNAYFPICVKRGLPYRNACDLVLHALKPASENEQDEFTIDKDRLSINLLGRIVETMPLNELLTSEKTFKKLMTRASMFGLLEGTLYAMHLGGSLGLSISHVKKMVDRVISDGHLGGYTMPHFLAAFETLKYSTIKSSVVVQAFEQLGGDRPYLSRDDYDIFAELITFGCPRIGRTPEEVLEKIAGGYSAKKLLLEKSKKMGDIQLYLSQKTQSNYFTHVSGPLEHAALPYRNKRDFLLGLGDLKRLADARTQKFQSVAEGFWVFDPGASVWFSLGGRTDPPARHQFLPYDASSLSKNPLFCHVHPDELKWQVPFPHDSTYSSTVRRGLRNLIGAVPSGADYLALYEMSKTLGGEYRPTMIIVHGKGITKVQIPNEKSIVNSIHNKNREILLSMSLECPVKSWANGGENFMLEKLVSNYASRVPAGVGIELQLYE